MVVAVTNSRLGFRPWERIFHGEFDGGRRKRVLVKIVGEKCEQSRMGLSYVHHPRFRGQGYPRPR